MTQGQRDAGGMTKAERKNYESKKAERKYRTARRKVREAEGEVDELNITAMMDMMTILLVFLLKSYSSSTVSVAISPDLTPPESTAFITPQETASVTITQSGISLGDHEIAPIENGKIPAQFFQSGSIIIQPLFEALKKEVAKQKAIGVYNKAVQFEGLLSIIGDKNTSYQLLFSVLVTAGQAELSNYKFIVLKPG